MEKPIVIERFTDNGEHSHWELVNSNGEVLWDSWDTPWSQKQKIEEYESNLKAREKELLELLDEYKLKCGGVVENFAHELPKEPLTEALNKHDVMESVCPKCNAQTLTIRDIIYCQDECGWTGQTAP
jgi:hypothetical protein